MKGANFIQE